MILSPRFTVEDASNHVLQSCEYRVICVKKSFPIDLYFKCHF